MDAKGVSRIVRAALAVTVPGSAPPASADPAPADRQRRADGTYTFSFVWRTAATCTYRVVVPGTGANATGVSGTVRVKVS